MTAVLVGAGIAFAPTAAVADSAPIDDSPKTVTTDALPTVQINGIVWDQVVVGNTVYAVGQFSTARPAGSAAGVNESVRNNVLAYDIRTGALLPFAPNVNAQTRTIAASPNGTRLYIGGDFTSVNGSTRNRVAAFDIPSGSLVSNWAPSVNASVRGIDATNNAVYFTGIFGRVASNDRVRAAAVSAAGALLPWAPTLDDGRGNDIVVSPDGAKVVIGGHFTTLNHRSDPGYGLAAVDAVSGATLPFATNSTVRNAGPDAAIWSLSKDEDSVYGTGYHFGAGGNLEGIFRTSWETGDLIWAEDCHGDTYSSFAVGGVVYGAGHSHYCGSIEGGFPQSEPWTFYRGVAFSKAVERITPYGLGYGYHDWGGTPAPKMLHWQPQFNTGTVSGASQGPWNVTGNSDYIVMGGEFTRVNNVGQQGLVRFARTEIAPNTDGPRLSSSTWVPTAKSIAAGTVRVSWPLNYDRDNEFLTYKVIRDGQNASPIHTQVARSKSADWALPGLSFIDRDVAQGSTHTYRLRAEDPKGNVAWSSIITTTVDGTGQMTDYASAVLGDSPTSYWPLNDGAGSTSYDWSGSNDLAINGGVTRNVAGALIDATAPAARFNGSGDGFAAASTAVEGPQTFAVEAWIKTTTTAGGKIVGFGNSATGTSSSYDRHVYMQTSGQLSFGVYPGSERVVTSPNSYNDGQWHHVVASLGAEGMTLFVDGIRVGQRSDTTSAQGYSGHWRVGGDTSWAGAAFFAGDIDEVAVYAQPLTRSQVQSHFVASGRELAGSTAPADAYGAAVYSEEPSLYWRLGESSGSVAADSSGMAQPGNYFGGHSKSAAGALADVANSAVAFSGGQVISNSSFTNPTNYSLEAWFKTTSTSGGKIIGFGNSPDGNSNSYDRHVYMTDSGSLVFGVWVDFAATIQTPASYNDGAWHHVVATQGGSGMQLFVDGALVGSNGQTGAQNYTGYWHVGGDVTWGPGNWEFLGAIDEVAVYPVALTASTVSEHYSLGTTGEGANVLPNAVFAASAAKLNVSVDASTSSDPDGTIAEYSWNWGDGSPTSTGATATHTYATAGDHVVTLTVTDNRGGVSTVSKTVTTVANAAPVAAFSETLTPLKISVNAAASADSDGTIVSYTWNWGDGTPTSTGATATHTYAAAATHDVSLTVVDNDGASTTLVKSVVVPPVPANIAPTASFTHTTAGLTASFNGSASTDSDGTVASYSWNWGDGTPTEIADATASHTYSAAGEFPVTLTVTDDDGVTGAVTHTVTVSVATGAVVLAADAFTRTLATGLGTADTGGAWTLGSAATNYGTNGAGVFRLPAGGSLREAYLNGVSSDKTTATVDTTIAQRPVGSSAYGTLIGRRVGTLDYRARFVVAPTGVTTVQILRGNTVLTTQNTGLTVAAGDVLSMRIEVTGTSPTSIKTRVWAAGSTEPTTWQATATDSTAGLQAAGSVGLSAYIGGSVTNLPYVLAFDNLLVTEPGAVVAPNTPPVAALTATASGLTASFSGAGSTDADGSIASYAWTFGDGATATGVTVEHTYTTGGTYPVQLTVTDNRGASHTATGSVTVAPVVVPPAGVLADDLFDRASTASWGSAVTGGAWTLSGSAASFTVGTGAGQVAVPAGSTRLAYLTGVSSAATDLTVPTVLPALPAAGSVYVSYIGRRVGTEDYRARVVVAQNGTAQLQVQRTATTLSTVNLPGLTIAPGAEFNVRVQVFGASPTTVRAKVWAAGTTEPAAWQISVTDSTAGLQAAGHIGVGGYVGGGVTNTPLAIAFNSVNAVAIP